MSHIRSRPIPLLAIAAQLAATPALAQSPPADIDARLEAARQRLEAAARELAELTAQSTARFGDRLLATDGRRPRAIIGVQIDPEPAAEGARVLRVSPGGPAAEAGIEAGDVITEIDGKSLRDPAHGGRALVEHMRGVEPKQRLRLRLLRDGRSREVVVVAGVAPLPRVLALPPGLEPPAVPAAPDSPDAPEAHGRPDIPFDWSPLGPTGAAGLELASLTPGLGAYFGTERGVLVLRAPRDPAWKLADGDVLLAIDGREPATALHATRILRSYQPGETVRMQILRQRKALQLEVQVPPGIRRREPLT
jgi:S1-C subfamily serine protease